MSWIDPLDRVPQIPVDYANHIVWGGFLGLFVASAIKPWMSGSDALVASLCTVFVVALVKKTADFIKEHETLEVCVSKTAVTCAIPALMVVAHAGGL